jgi:uncharacterized repeat protein (TIGR03803 family)
LTDWTYKVLHGFAGKPDGCESAAGLIMDEHGALYGTTMSGGESDLGTVFSLKPPAPGSNKWRRKILHNFAGKPDGVWPRSALTMDDNGILYGTTMRGGFGEELGNGTIFSLTPPLPGSARWRQTVLHRFAETDGEVPSPTLIWDGVGTLYGTTYYGGASERGTIFKLVP